MLIKDYKKYINLSRVLNSTFGVGGTEHQPSTTQSISFKLLDDGMLKCTFMMVINFGSNSMLREMNQRYKSEAKAMLKAALERITEDYKVKFPDSEVPKFNVLEDTENDDVEALSYSLYGQPNKGYYRYGVLVSVE